MYKVFNRGHGGTANAQQESSPRDKGHEMKEKSLLHYKHEDYTIDFVTGQINYMITPINFGKDKLQWMQQITIKEPI